MSDEPVVELGESVEDSPAQRHRDRMLDEIEYWKERALSAERRCQGYAEQLATARMQLEAQRQTGMRR